MLFKKGKGIGRLAGAIIASILIGISAGKCNDLAEQNRDLRANQEQLIKKEETQVTTYEFSKKDMEQYIDERLTEHSRELDSAGIKKKDIKTLISQEIQHRDTAKAITTVQPIVEAIKRDVELAVPFLDSTPCMTFGGHLIYNGDSLFLEVEKRSYTGTINTVVHLFRPKKKVLFFKTRWFSKKSAKVTTFSDCGTSKTIIINNRDLKKRRGKTK